MQVDANALAGHLERGLLPVYTVWGDEPLLAQEACDAIRAAARAAGCSERQVHTVSGAHFDWSSLLGAAQALQPLRRSPAGRDPHSLRASRARKGRTRCSATARRRSAGAGRDVITLAAVAPARRPCSRRAPGSPPSTVHGLSRCASRPVERAGPAGSGSPSRHVARRGSASPPATTASAHAGLLRRPGRRQPARRAPGDREARPAVTRPAS